MKNKFNKLFTFHFSLFTSQKGFSLIELLLYIGILSILVVVTSGIFISLNTGRGKSEAQSEVNSNLRFAVEKISQDIKAASAVNTPATVGATSASLAMVVGSDIITYDVSAGRLRRQVNSNTPEAITSDMVEVNTTDAPLTFTRLENTNSVFSPPRTTVSIEIAMNINYKSSSPDWQYAASKKTAISLR